MPVHVWIRTVGFFFFLLYFFFFFLFSSFFQGFYGKHGNRCITHQGTAIILALSEYTLINEGRPIWVLDILTKSLIQILFALRSRTIDPNRHYGFSEQSAPLQQEIIPASNNCNQADISLFAMEK